MSSVLHRMVKDRPAVAVEGRGIYLRLSDGAEIIDAAGGAAVAVIGHGNQRVASAMAEQAGRLAYAHTGFFSSEPAEELAELLVGDRPGGLSRAFFISSGSEAMESALKLARQYFVESGEPERTHYISRQLSYHGNTFGALAASGNLARRTLYEPVLPSNFSRVSACFPYRGQGEGESDAAYVARLAAELEAEFQRIGPNRVIAFLAEPVVGAVAGCVVAVPGYFAAIREVCDRHGTLMILDEIMCGMGRTGVTHAWEREGVTPDIQTIAKGLGGGYAPIGGMLVADKVIARLESGTGGFVHGHTYQAHPVSCRAALEVQRIIREEGLVGRVNPMGSYLSTRLHDAFDEHPFVGQVRGRGLFYALELVADRDRRLPFPPRDQMHERLKLAALARGLGIYPTAASPAGEVGDNVIIAPPFNVKETEIDAIVERLVLAVDEATRRGETGVGGPT